MPSFTGHSWAVSLTASTRFGSGAGYGHSIRGMWPIERAAATVRDENNRGATDLDVHGGKLMGTEARIGLLLGAAACLLAVMVDWIVEELNGD